MAAENPLESTKPVTFKALTSILRGVMVPIMKELHAKLEKRLEKLEGNSGADLTARAYDLDMRIRALEDRPKLHYCGLWDTAKTYERGSFVTWGGSMWATDTLTKGQEPGGGSNVWTLAVMRGRQGKQGAPGR